MTADRERWIIATLAVACAALAVAATHFQPTLFFQDASHYLSLAEHIARGDGYHSDIYLFPDLMQPPLYPLLVALGIEVGLSPEVAAIAICVAAQVVALRVAVALYASLFGRAGRWVVAACAAVCVNVALGGALTLEPLYGALLAGAAWLALGCTRVRPLRAAGAGLCLGLALVTRSEAVISAGVIAIAIACWPRARGNLRAIGAFVAAAALVVVPYGLWMRAQLGDFEVLPKLRYNVPFADITDHMAWAPDQVGLTARDLRVHESVMPDHATFVLDYAFHHPEFEPRAMFPRTSADGVRARILVATAYRMAVDGIRETGLFHPILLALLIAGILFGIARRDGEPADELAARRWRTLVLVALIATNLLPALAAGENYQPRFTMPSILFSLPLVGGGVGGLAARIYRRWPRVSLRAAWGAIAIVVIALYATRSWRTFEEAAGGDRIEARMRATDAAMERVVPEGATVMCPSARTAYLRHGHSVQFPYAEDRAVLTDYVAHHGVAYALLDTRVLVKDPGPENRRLIDRAAWPPGWTPLVELFAGDEPIWIVQVR